MHQILKTCQTFVKHVDNTQQIAVASMVMSDGAVVVINNEDHIETEVPQDEE